MASGTGATKTTPTHATPAAQGTEAHAPQSHARTGGDGFEASPKTGTSTVPAHIPTQAGVQAPGAAGSTGTPVAAKSVDETSEPVKASAAKPGKFAKFAQKLAVKAQNLWTQAKAVYKAHPKKAMAAIGVGGLATAIGLGFANPALGVIAGLAVAGVVGYLAFRHVRANLAAAKQAESAEKGLEGYPEASEAK